MTLGSNVILVQGATGGDPASDKLLFYALVRKCSAIDSPYVGENRYFLIFGILIH